MTESIDPIDANEARSIDNRTAIAELRAAIEADRDRAEADLARVREENQAGLARLREELAAQREENEAGLARLREELAVQKERFEAERLELRMAVNFLIQTTEQHQRNFEVMVTEMNGLKRENQRILDYLFGQQQNDNN